MNKNIFYILLILASSTLTVSAQCYPDQHSTSWFEGWVSCDKSSNPNAGYGDSHWIMYDLGYDYVLNEMKLWNANEPNNLDYGIKDYNIDYSSTGSTWENLGSFSLDQSDGRSNYEGTEGPDFDGLKARYVLITPTTNYGGNCFGFSEMKINITDPFEVIDEEDGFNASIYPNPFVNDVSMRIASLYPNKPITYTLHDILGRVITQNVITITAESDTYEVSLNGNSLSLGIYILNIEQNGKQKAFKLIKKE